MSNTITTGAREHGRAPSRKKKKEGKGPKGTFAGKTLGVVGGVRCRPLKAEISEIKGESLWSQRHATVDAGSATDKSQSREDHHSEGVRKS